MIAILADGQLNSRLTENVDRPIFNSEPLNPLELAAVVCHDGQPMTSAMAAIMRSLLPIICPARSSSSRTRA
jgi:hypothetical protein